MQSSRVTLGQRLVFLDALRGIAALEVAWFHFYWMTPLRTPLTLVVPAPIRLLWQEGALGVQVFFVLSGFVIALSISDRQISAGFVGRFALRRSLRLDPPYWAALAVAVVLLTGAARAPSTGQVLAHVIYLQGILGYPQIVSVFWTLCYEVQFYLVLAVGLWMVQRSGARTGYLLMTSSLVISLLFPTLGAADHGVFLDRWYGFALGVITFLTLTGSCSWRSWGFAVALALGCGLVSGNIEVIACVCATVLIAGVGRAGRLAEWSGGRVLQHLGKLSYSLYLLHFIGNSICKIAGARPLTPPGALGVFIVATMVSLLVAQCCYLLIERPAHRLSRRIPLDAPVNRRGIPSPVSVTVAAD